MVNGLVSVGAVCCTRSIELKIGRVVYQYNLFSCMDLTISMSYLLK